MKHKYIVGLYDDEEPLLDGCTKIRKAGYRMHEIFTPFPVHGLDQVMGLQETRLHTIGFAMGATGTLFALTAMAFITSMDWPINVGGKPFFALPSFVPITFELTVLFAAVGMTITFYLRNGFSVFKEKEILDPRTTDDRFAMVFCCKKHHNEADQERIKTLLKETGAVEVRYQNLENELTDNLWKSDEEYFDSLEAAPHH